MLTMERGLSIVLASAILLGGIIVALIFRRHLPSSAPDFTECPETLSVRQQLDRWVPQAEARRHAERVRLRQETRQQTSAPTILTPVADQQLPPTLPPSFPRTESTDSSRSTVPTGLDLQGAFGMPRGQITHTIVDGDTLASLAHHYLGSAERAMEIYEANREVLPEPDLLPIGAKLRIPPPEVRRVPSKQKADFPSTPVPPRNT